MPDLAKKDNHSTSAVERLAGTDREWSISTCAKHIVDGELYVIDFASAVFKSCVEPGQA